MQRALAGIAVRVNHQMLAGRERGPIGEHESLAAAKEFRPKSDARERNGVARAVPNFHPVRRATHFIAQAADVVRDDLGDFQRWPWNADRERVRLWNLAARNESRVPRRRYDLIADVRALEIELDFRSGRQCVREGPGEYTVTSL